MYRTVSSRRYVLRWRIFLGFFVAGTLASCGGTAPQTTVFVTPTIANRMEVSSPLPSPVPTIVPDERPAADVSITVDSQLGRHPISPFIYGVNGADADVLARLRPTLNRWGGNASTRYNWQIGNAWNAGSDWQYRNGDYGYKGQLAYQDFIQASRDGGADIVLTVPTLGWVAKNNNTAACSFPGKSGECGDSQKADCAHPGAIADPTTTSVRSDVQSVVRWMEQIKNQGIRFVAMDNEPDLWGYTHYDVHPTCTSYDEIRDKYIEYASAIRQVMPQAELLGPVSCCWHYYWNSTVGEADRERHGGQDFIPWFLQQVHSHDQEYGKRTLDVLDIHFYPEGLYNDETNAQIDALRLRSTRSLWDANYVDESWIAQPVALIPRMKQIIQQHYPGTKLGLSEWNWGADKTVPGALALAEVLGIFGREDVYLANYWRYPEARSPGFYAFQMFTNYDQQGGRFGEISVHAASTAPERVSAFAGVAVDGKLTLLLINKDPERALEVGLDLRNFPHFSKATLFQYSANEPNGVKQIPLASVPSRTKLPAYSLSLVVAEIKQ